MQRLFRRVRSSQTAGPEYNDPSEIAIRLTGPLEETQWLAMAERREEYRAGVSFTYSKPRLLEGILAAAIESHSPRTNLKDFVTFLSDSIDILSKTDSRSHPRISDAERSRISNEFRFHPEVKERFQCTLEKFRTDPSKYEELVPKTIKDFNDIIVDTVQAVFQEAGYELPRECWNSLGRDLGKCMVSEDDVGEGLPQALILGPTLLDPPVVQENSDWVKREQLQLWSRILEPLIPRPSETLGDSDHPEADVLSLASDVTVVEGQGHFGAGDDDGVSLSSITLQGDPGSGSYFEDP